MLRVQTANPASPKEVRLVRTGVNAVGVVEHFADLYAATDQLVASSPDVRDNQVQSLCGAGCGRSDVLAEDHRARGAGWRELDHAEVAIVGSEVGVEPPPQADIKALGAIDVRYRDDDDLELHVAGHGKYRIHCAASPEQSRLSRSSDHAVRGSSTSSRTNSVCPGVTDINVVP